MVSTVYGSTDNVHLAWLWFAERTYELLSVMLAHCFKRMQFSADLLNDQVKV